MKIVRAQGLGLGTVFYAQGTSRQKLWRFLGLDEVT